MIRSRFTLGIRRAFPIPNGYVFSRQNPSPIPVQWCLSAWVILASIEAVISG